MHDQAAGDVDHLRNWNQVAQWLHWKLDEYARIDRHRADVAEQDVVAVRRCASRNFHADIAARAGPIIDDDLFAEQLGHARLDDARDEVRGSAGSERHDHPYRAVWILLSLGAGSRDAESRQRAGGQYVRTTRE